jgi:Regulator of chromosome condensation (RCC1) repeat
VHYYRSVQHVGVRHIACGSGHTVVLSNAGEIYSVGRGDDGRLGHGDNGWKCTFLVVVVFLAWPFFVSSLEEDEGREFEKCWLLPLTLSNTTIPPNYLCTLFFLPIDAELYIVFRAGALLKPTTTTRRTNNNRCSPFSPGFIGTYYFGRHLWFVPHGGD